MNSSPLLLVERTAGAWYYKALDANLYAITRTFSEGPLGGQVTDWEISIERDGGWEFLELGVFDTLKEARAALESELDGV